MDLRGRDVAGEREPHASGARGNRRRTNGPYDKSVAVQLPRDVQRHFIAAKQYRNDVALGISAAQTASAQLLAERRSDVLQVRAPGIG